MAFTKDKIERNRKELLDKLEEINGKTVRQIDITDWMGSHPKAKKGSIGEIVQIYLGKAPDNDSDRDFPEADVELKATGLVAKNSKKNSYSAKERLVLTMINYKENRGVSFKDSHLLSKCHALLITCYSYQYDKDGKPLEYGSFPFVDSFIYELTGDDKRMIEDDYDIILKKINEGKAETISESDTHYLEACPKGRNGNDKVEQYGSSNKAMRRAFAFKPSFLNAIIRQHISNETYESILAGVSSMVGEKKFEDRIKEQISPYFGQKASDLFTRFCVNPKAKGRFASLISKIVGKKDLADTEEFQKANIHIKTVRIEQNGKIIEQMSFPAFNFFTLAYTPWDESSEQAFFNGAELMIPVFRDKGEGYVLDDVIFYKLPDIVTEGFIRYTYEKTQETLLSGNIVKCIKKNEDGNINYRNNFVGIAENPICHVRPHARNFDDTKPLPVPDRKTGLTSYEKQCLWLGNDFIKAIVENRADKFIQVSLKKMKTAGHKIQII